MEGKWRGRTTLSQIPGYATGQRSSYSE